jgi:very-short-patch-repair endonuclease
VPSKEIARNLRQKQTKGEKELWQALRGRQFAGFKFRRQHIAFGYILGFLLRGCQAGGRTGWFSTWIA